MNPNETDEELAARTAMGAAMRRLGNALVGHRVTIDVATRVAAVASALADEAEQLPVRDRLSELADNARFGADVERLPTIDIDPDGGPMDLFVDSPVSGSANPVGIGLRVHREGDAAVGTVVFGPAVEGAPRRAHGGVVAAVIDETMGFVMSIAGELAYTANLNIDFVGPAPMHVPVRITARVRDRSGRKLWVEATGEGPDGVFVRAEALFLTIDLSRFRLESVD
jgi:acyl-coenzyme A thioesterase PaaI-like protein